MKKLSLIVTVIFLAGLNSLWGQAGYVTKNMVLIEVATGTWCVYCPGAAMAVDQMEAEGLSVAIVENHGSDDFAYSGSNARNNLYEIDGFPTGVFNGTQKYVGGSSSSIYSTYRPIYNQSVQEQTAFNLTSAIIRTGESSYRANVTINKIATYSGTNLNLFIIVTESHIPFSWMSQSEVNFVNRSMITGNDGLDLTLDNSGAFSQSFDFNIPSTWDVEHCQVIVFIQDMDSKEVLNTTKDEIPIPVIQNAASIKSVIVPDDMECTRLISPQVEIKNDGAMELQSLTINYKINSGELKTFQWSGHLANNTSTLVTLPEVGFTPISSTNKVTVEIENPNGVTDEITGDDAMSKTFTQHWSKNQFIEIKTSTDYNGNETSWDLVDGNNQVVLHGGNYQSGKDYYSYYEPENNSCYSLKVYDSGGDGIDGGGIELMDYNSQKLIAEFTRFGSNDKVGFGTEYTTSGSLSMRDQFNKPIKKHDTITIEGFAYDSLVGAKLKIINNAPLTRFVQVSATITSFENDLQPRFIWNQHEEQYYGAAQSIGGLFSAPLQVFIRPDEKADSCFVNYKLIANEPDTFDFTVRFVALSHPPIVLKMMDNQGTYFANTDTINYEGYLSEMCAIQSVIWFENKSTFDITVSANQVISSDQYSSFLSWDSPVTILPSDTCKSLAVTFATAVVGSYSTRLTFIPNSSPADSLSLMLVYKVKPDPDFKLFLKTGSDSTNSLELNYPFFDTHDAAILTNNIQLVSYSNYPVQIVLNEAITLGEVNCTDSTFWNGKSFKSLHGPYNDTLTLEPGIAYDAFSTALYPPYQIGSFSKLLTFTEAGNELHYCSLLINYDFSKDTTDALIQKSGETLPLVISPNPVNDQLYLFIDQELVGQMAHLLIYDMAGRLMQRETFTVSMLKQSLNVSSLPKGMYHVSASFENGTRYNCLINKQ